MQYSPPDVKLPRVISLGLLPDTAGDTITPAGRDNNASGSVQQEHSLNSLQTAAAVTALSLAIHCVPVDRPAPEELMVAMRDGVKLRTSIRRPGFGRYPVVLIRGYDTDFWGGISGRFLDAGYVFVGQATRGHLGSEGSQGMDNVSSTTRGTATTASTGSAGNLGATARSPCTAVPTTARPSGSQHPRRIPI